MSPGLLMIVFAFALEINLIICYIYHTSFDNSVENLFYYRRFAKYFHYYS